MNIEKSLVILYTGNVCSSPLNYAFNRVEKCFAPLHEHLDKYYLSKMWNDDIDECFVDTISDIKSNTYSQRCESLKIDDFTDNLSCENTSVFVFKWRPFEAVTKEGKIKQIKALESLNAVPVVLVRSSVVEQAIKIHMNEKVYKSRHLQFNAGKMTPAEYQKFIEEQADIKVTFEQLDINEVKNIAENFIERTRKTLLLGRRLFDVKPTIVLSEDLFTPLINETVFCETFSRLLGMKVELETEVPTQKEFTRKSGLSLCNLLNIENVICDPQLVKLEDTYENLIKNGNEIDLTSFLSMFDIDYKLPIPQHYVDDFRDMAMKFEHERDISSAKELMYLAHLGRPKGAFIQNKLNEYNALLAAY